ncbi:MAG: hypothetical protein NT062_36855 [Proteobacteria bacterium]|nr:hypothetical protein [Pseudomonadota bacterium]
MARRKMQHGTCRLCGNVGDLTFEHIPPQKAFNNLRTISLSWDQAMRLGPDEPVKGKVDQGGVGMYTLCPSCNNNTGGWYARALVTWCYRGMDILERSKGSAPLFHMRGCYPLRVLKEIMVMFCSVNPEMTDKQPWLRRLLLDTHGREWDVGWRLFLYFNVEGKLRYSGTSGSFDFETGDTTVMSEINYPPFGYVLVMDGAPPDDRLTEITHFIRYGFDEMAELAMPMSVLSTHSKYAGDYRTRDQILRDREAGLAAQAEMRAGATR